MVLPVTRFISNPSSTGVRKEHRPALNSIPVSQTTKASKAGSFNSYYRDFMRKFKRSPELYGIINVLVTDIIGDRPYFTKPDGSPLGRNGQLKANRFWRSNRIKETLKAMLFDAFITGDGYGWKAKPSDEEKRRAVKEVMQKYKMMLKDTAYSQLFIKAIQDEDFNKTKAFDYIAATTVQINNTPYDITGYTQVSNGITTHFNLDEVIHYRLTTLDGNVYGFSPVESLAKELALLYFVKGNMLAYMNNGGRPEILFTLKNAQPGSNSYNNFAQQLQAFKQLENRHGGLLATGDTDVKDLSFGMQKDMEYQNLALWVISSMLFAFGIPTSRVPFLVGKAANMGDSGGLTEKGYQSMISEKQDEIEDLMNLQLFEELGFHMHLPRNYKQDEVREAQTFSMNADTVMKLQDIYMKQGKKVSTHKLNLLLDISMDDLEDLSEEEKMMSSPINAMALRNQNMLDNNSIDKEPDNRKKADTKRNVANQRDNKSLSV